MINTNTRIFSGRVFSALFLALAACAFLVVNSTKAYAHAELESSIPGINESVSSLSEVSLTFNEEVLPIKIEINSENSTTSLDYSGEKIKTIKATPSVDLKDSGTYFITYQVVSEDSHVVSGVVPFSIGLENSSYTPSAGNSTVVVPGPSEENPEGPTFFLDRALELLSWVFFFIVLGLILAERNSKAPVFILLGLGSASLRLLGFYDTFSSSFWKINETYSVLLVLAAYILALLVLILKNKKLPLLPFKTLSNKSTKLTASAALVAAPALFAAQAFYSGHFTNDTLFVSLNFIHLLGATLWCSALVSILSNTSSSNITRSSRVATASVILLIVSTIIMFFVFVLEFLNSQWGLLILAKVMLVLAALTIGLLNNIKVRSLSKKPLNTLPSLVKSIKHKTIAELVILIFVILLAASLSLTSPYDSSSSKYTTELGASPVMEVIPDVTENYTSSEQLVEESPPNPVEISITFDFDFTGKLILSSTRNLTPIELELYVYSDSGDLLEPIQAEYDFYSASNDLEGFNSYFTQHDDHLMSSFLAPADGDWAGVVTVQVDDFTSLEGEVNFTIE